MTSAGNKDMGGPEDLGASPQVPAPIDQGHTPGPWRVEEGTTVIWSDNSYDEGTGCVGCIVARAAQPPSWKASRPTADEQQANAAFIVLACNLHDEMKEALEPFANLGVGQGPDDEHDLASYRILRGAIRKARAALAKITAGE